MAPCASRASLFLIKWSPPCFLVASPPCSKPVRHARLVGALLKAAAFSRSKQQAPLHSDASMMTAMPDRISLNRLAVNRRISLDNSALDRRRWDASAAAAAAAAAAEGSSPHQAALANGNGAGGAAPGDLDASSLPPPRRSVEGHPGGTSGWQPQLPAILSDDSAGGSSQRSSMDAGASGLPTIPEQMPSMPGSPFATRAQRPVTPEEPATLEPAVPAGHDLRILVAEDNLVNQMVIRKVLQVGIGLGRAHVGGGSAGLCLWWNSKPAPFSCVAPTPPCHPAVMPPCHSHLPAPSFAPPLQRVVPAATVEIVGNGALALEAALARRPDLILMDIHMPGQRLCLLEEAACMRCMLSWPVCPCCHACQLLLLLPPPLLPPWPATFLVFPFHPCLAEMDGIESSRRLHEALPPDEAPIVVALSADTLQVRRPAPAAALAPASCCALPCALPYALLRPACLLELSNAEQCCVLRRRGCIPCCSAPRPSPPRLPSTPLLPCCADAGHQVRCRRLLRLHLQALPGGGCAARAAPGAAMTSSHLVQR